MDWAKTFKNKLILPDLEDHTEYLISLHNSLDYFEKVMDEKIKSSEERELRNVLELMK